MKNFLNLNAELEKLYKPKIQVFNNFRNIMFNGLWVNEIYDKVSFFYDWEEDLKNKINNISDPDSPTNIKFIKVFQQDVLQKYDKLNKIDYHDLNYLQSFSQFPITFDDSSNPSKINHDEFYYHPDNDIQFGEFLERIARIFDIENFSFYDNEYSPDSLKDILDEQILINQKSKENELNKFYSLGFLSYCLDNTKFVLKNIAEHLDSFVSLIKKLENYKEDEFTLDEIYDNDPNNLKLEFKINKMEVALFYRVLQDTGVIDVNNQGQKHPYTNLKKYINSSNMYYLDNMKVDKVKNINKEFSKFLNDNKYEKQEIEVLELIISKFKNRKEEILASQEEGLA